MVNLNRKGRGFTCPCFYKYVFFPVKSFGLINYCKSPNIGGLFTTTPYFEILGTETDEQPLS